MQMTIPQGLYFSGTTRELRCFLTNLSNYYTTVNQLLHREDLKNNNLQNLSFDNKQCQTNDRVLCTGFRSVYKQPN
jgi:hypothetical protein